jgi:hypothetical protein
MAIFTKSTKTKQYCVTVFFIIFPQIGEKKYTLSTEIHVRR